MLKFCWQSIYCNMYCKCKCVVPRVMKAYGGADIGCLSFLTSALDTAVFSAPRLCLFTHTKTASGICRTADCMGLRTHLRAQWKIKSYCLCLESNYVSSTVQPVIQSLYRPKDLLYERKMYFCQSINLLNPTCHVMHQQFNIQQLYALPTLYLCVLYFSENKQRLVPLTA